MSWPIFFFFCIVFVNAREMGPSEYHHIRRIVMNHTSNLLRVLYVLMRQLADTAGYLDSTHPVMRMRRKGVAVAVLVSTWMKETTGPLSSS